MDIRMGISIWGSTCESPWEFPQMGIRMEMWEWDGNENGNSLPTASLEIIGKQKVQRLQLCLKHKFWTGYDWKTVLLEMRALLSFFIQRTVRKIAFGVRQHGIFSLFKL